MIEAWESGFRYRFPRCFRLVPEQHECGVPPANETEEHTGSGGLCGAPCEFHRMFTRLLSSRIDDVGRRPVPAIPIPPPPVSPRSVSPMECPYQVRDAFDPHGSTQG